MIDVNKLKSISSGAIIAQQQADADRAAKMAEINRKKTESAKIIAKEELAKAERFLEKQAGLGLTYADVYSFTDYSVISEANLNETMPAFWIIQDLRLVEGLTVELSYRHDGVGIKSWWAIQAFW